MNDPDNLEHTGRDPASESAGGARGAAEPEAPENEMDSLKRELAEQKELVRQLSFDLEERRKELRCHNEITLLLQNASMKPEEFCQKVVETLPMAFQFPDIASACLRVCDREYISQGYEDCSVSLGVDVLKHDTVIGTLEICYRTGGAEKTSGWFLSEETDLLRAVAQRISKYVERAELESVLREKERLHNSIMDFSPDIITITDLEGRVEYSSGKAAEMFGREPAAAFNNIPVIDFIDPCDRARAMSGIADMLRGASRGAEEYRAVRLDGTVFDIEVNGEILRDAQGQPSKILFVTRDITRRKEAERKLAATETLYRQMIESINDALYEISMDGTIKYVSPVIKRILGYDSGDVTGGNIFHYMYSEDVPMVKKALRELSPGVHTNLHYRYFNKDGSVRWIRSSTEPIFENGEMVGARGTLTDIHTQKLAELALHESENRLRWLFEKMPQGVLYSDANMNITASNPAVERILKISPDDFEKDVPPEGHLQVYREDGTSIEPDDYPSRVALRTGKAVRDKVLRFFYPATDESLWMLISAEPEFREGEKKPCRVFTTFTDITGLKETEKELTSQKNYNDSLFAAIPDLIFVLNHSGDIVEFKAGREEELAMPPEAFLNRNISEVLPGELSERIRDRLGDLSFGKIGDPIQYEMMVDGKVGHYEARLSRFGDDKILVLVSNISWRVKADRALRDSEEKYRSLIDSSDATIFMIDPEGHYLYMNRIGARPFGLSPDEVVGKSVHDLFPPANAAQIVDSATRVLDGNEGFVLEEEIEVAGERRWYRTSMQPVRNDSGQPFAVMMYATNITEMKLAELKIRQSEENYRSLFYNSPDGYLIFREGRFVDCNKVAEEMIGYDRLDLVGKTPCLISPEYQPNGKKSEEYVIEVVRDTFLQGHNAFEWMHRRSDGRDILVQVKTSVMDLNNDKVLVVSWRDITQQRKSEEQIRKLSRVVEESPVFVVITDTEGTIEYVNASFLKRTGYTHDEVIGLNPRILKSGFHSEEFYRELWETIISGKEWSGQICNRAKNGERYWEKAYIIPIIDEKGAISNFVGIKEDITEQRKIIRAIEESEERLNYAQELASMGSWELDIGTGRVSWSRNYYRLVGEDPSRPPLSLEEMKQRIHPDDREIFDVELQDMEQKRSPGKLIFRLIMPEGDIKWIRANIVPQLESGRLVSVRGISLDITERMENEAEIRKLNMAIEQSPVVFLIKDLDGIITYVSPAFSRLTGYSSDEIRGKHVSLLRSEKTDDAFYDALWRTVRAGGTWQGEWLSRRKNGEEYPERITINPILDEMGRIISYLSIKEDLTIQKKAQHEQIARQAAEQANRAKSVFLANMSHEIRTPLNAIIGFSQILKRDAALPENQREQVQTILRSGEHLLSLINDVLDLSKIEAGHMRLINADFCLNDLLDSLETMFRLRVRDKGLQLIVERHGSVPGFVNADEGKLRQVLINLLGNAIKFTKKGSVTARFQAEEVPDFDAKFCLEEAGCLHLKVEIEDTGPGISGEDLAHIFESFHQSEAGREAGGTGLGLTISRNLIEMMGGSIAVESRLGEGSIFRFHVPVKQGQTITSQKEAAFSENIVGLKPDTGPFRILAVDDNIDNLNLLQAILEPLGFQVKTAGNGLDGLNAFMEWSPHAVLMDMRMPVMDGYEAIRKIKSTLKGRVTLVIALTASAFEEQKDRVMATGANDYLRKPFQREALLMKLRKVPGLQYVCEEYGDAEEEGGGARIPAADEVAALPEHLVASMREAIAKGNMTRLRNLVAEVEKISPRTAMGLAVLVKEYDYDRLGELLAIKGDNEHGKGK
ncbi:MAG: PAS domain S-box protein [Candidatus Xenobiia bacterium LiM19]